MLRIVAIILFCSLLISCRTGKNLINKECSFDKYSNRVIGNDGVTYITSDYGADVFLTYVLNELSDGLKKIVIVNPDFKVMPKVNYEINGCPDTTWAKLKIYNNLLSTYDVIIRDTTLYYNEFELEIIDHDLVPWCDLSIDDNFYQMGYTTTLEDGIKYSVFDCQCCSWPYISEYLIFDIKQSNSKINVEKLNGKVSIKLRENYFDKIGLEAYNQYLNEKFGLNLKLILSEAFKTKSYEYLGLKKSIH